MNRPLERCGIAELETLVGNKGNTEVELEVLAGELIHRSSARAGKLLIKVRRAQKSDEMLVRIDARVAANNLAQAELPGMAGSKSEVPVATLKPVLTAPEPGRLPSTSAKTAAAPLPKMTAEQAYEYLKVPFSAGWEQVENARREIVARAQPDKLDGLPHEKRQALQDKSRLANAAYKSLLQR